MGDYFPKSYTVSMLSSVRFACDFLCGGRDPCPAPPRRIKVADRFLAATGAARRDLPRCGEVCRHARACALPLDKTLSPPGARVRPGCAGQ